MTSRPAAYLGALAILGALLLSPASAGGEPILLSHSCRCSDDPPGSETEEKDRPFPPAMEKKAARDLLRELKKPLQSKEPREKALAIERLKEHSSEEFVAPLAELAKDRDAEVAVVALAALAEQDFDAARSELLRLVRDRKVQEEEARLHAVVGALQRLGWDERGFRILREMFEDAEHTTKKELLHAFGARREVRAFSLFVDHLDAPRPDDVNGANNPPASYWKEKYLEWEKLKYPVAKGLERIAGQRFANAAAAIEWSKGKEAKKRGIRYEKGS